jgi:N-acetylglucosamine kinase-like BadF-type ATPase
MMSDVSDSSDRLVLGLDIGATSTRVVLANVAGERLSTGRAGGGNPNAQGPDRAAAAVLAALREALAGGNPALARDGADPAVKRDGAGVDPAMVRAGVLGLAGVHRLATDPHARAAFDAAWRDAGLRCPYVVVADELVAYASGTAQPTGTVLLAGTGAIAAAVRDYELERVADGHGWLLGDLGSGFWLGREAVRTALSDLDNHVPPGPLSALVLTEVLGCPDVATRPRKTAADLVQALNAGPPIALAAFAPLVMRAYASGDPAAVDVVRRAAGHLTRTVRTVRPPGAQTPIVLAGGLLTGDTVLAGEVRASLLDLWPDAAISTAGDGAAGAAWLAARTLPGADPAALHARLMG